MACVQLHWEKRTPPEVLKYLRYWCWPNSRQIAHSYSSAVWDKEGRDPVWPPSPHAQCGAIWELSVPYATCLTDPCWIGVPLSSLLWSPPLPPPSFYSGSPSCWSLKDINYVTWSLYHLQWSKSLIFLLLSFLRPGFFVGVGEINSFLLRWLSYGFST